MSKSEKRLVEAAFQKMPAHVRGKILGLRDLILRVGAENDSVGQIEETLKWGEPSYLCTKGSAVRLGWKSNAPDTYRILFNCQTKLVDTFKELYPDYFRFEGNRAIVFDLHEPIAETELRHCIELALKYHRLKHLPLLGS